MSVCIGMFSLPDYRLVFIDWFIEHQMKCIKKWAVDFIIKSSKEKILFHYHNDNT